jgi:hypothetical protein
LDIITRGERKVSLRMKLKKLTPPPEKIKTLAFPIYLINRSLIVPYNSIMTINLCSKLCLQEISRVSNNCTSVKLPGMKGRLCRKNHIEMILAKSSIAAVFSPWNRTKTTIRKSSSSQNLQKNETTIQK